MEPGSPHAPPRSRRRLEPPAPRHRLAQARTDRGPPDEIDSAGPGLSDAYYGTGDDDGAEGASGGLAGFEDVALALSVRRSVWTELPDSKGWAGRRARAPRQSWRDRVAMREVRGGGNCLASDARALQVATCSEQQLQLGCRRTDSGVLV